MAKLAQERANQNAWEGSISDSEAEFDHTTARFMKTVSVDVPRHYTKVGTLLSQSLKKGHTRVINFQKNNSAEGVVEEHI